MFFYVIVFIALVGAAFLEIVSNHKFYSKTVFYCFVFYFYLLSFLRWETGTDWEVYYEMYTWIKVPWNQVATMNMELGFTLANHLGKSLFNSYTGVLFILSTILYFFLAKSYLLLSKYPVTSLLFSFCVYAFAHILYVRQNIAIVILCLSLYYIKKQSFMMFFLLVLSASLFHRTSWIFLVCYPLFYKEYTLKNYVLILFIPFFLGTTVSEVLLPFIGNIGLGVISDKLSMYLALGTDDNTMNVSTTLILVKGFVNRIILLSIFFYCRFKLGFKNRSFVGLVNIYVLGTVLYVMFLPISITLGRIAVYMDVVQIFIIPYILQNQKGLYNRILLFNLFLLYYFSRFYVTFIAYEEYYVPFRTVFN